MDWATDERSLVCLLAAVPPKFEDSPAGHHVLLMCHAATEPCRFLFPARAARPLRLALFDQHGGHSPRDIYLDLDGPPAPADACRDAGAALAGLSDCAVGD